MTQALPQRRYRIFQAIPSLAAAVVAGVAVAALAGWAIDNDWLKSFLYPGHIAMNPATAIAFLLCAVSLWILRGGRGIAAARVCGAACDVAVLAIACGRLGAYLGLWRYRLDAALFAGRLHGNTMAPNTALAFLLIAIALLTIDLPPLGRFHLAQPSILITAAIAVLSLVGYFYNIAVLYAVRGAIPMALNTAILFLALSVGTLCSRLDREPLATLLSPTLGGVIARRLIPGAFLIPLLVGALLLIGWKHGLFDPALAMTLFVLAIILIFNALIWWSARVIHATDIDRQRAADELRLSERRYHAIMRQTVEGIYLLDLESHRILECNHAMAKMLGYDDGELENQPIFRLIDDAPDHVLARLERLRKGGTALQGERQYRRKDGSVIDVYAGATVISYGGRSAACTVIHDVTERNLAVRQLQEKHDQLQAALEQLRLAQSRLVQSEKLASLGQMVAGVAHEINNPLSFVSNNVAVLQRDTQQLCRLISLYARADEAIGKVDPALLEEVRDLAERMDLAYTQSNLATVMERSREGLRRIQQIVKDLRDFARLDESDLQEVDLNAGIESTVNIVAGRAKKKRVELKLDLKPLPRVTCYPAKLNQVVMNLVANAIDAAPEGGKVCVQSMRDGEGVRIVVTDNGSGVPAGIRDRIFDPFFTTKPQGEGTGLGLSISYGIVNDHGGRIEVADAVGGGATFTVTLPLCAAMPQRQESVSSV